MNKKHKQQNSILLHGGMRFLAEYAPGKYTSISTLTDAMKNSIDKICGIVSSGFNKANVCNKAETIMECYIATFRSLLYAGFTSDVCSITFAQKNSIVEDMLAILNDGVLKDGCLGPYVYYNLLKQIVKIAQSHSINLNLLINVTPSITDAHVLLLPQPMTVEQCRTIIELGDYITEKVDPSGRIRNLLDYYGQQKMYAFIISVGKMTYSLYNKANTLESLTRMEIAGCMMRDEKIPLIIEGLRMLKEELDAVIDSDSALLPDDDWYPDQESPWKVKEVAEPEYDQEAELEKILSVHDDMFDDNVKTVKMEKPKQVTETRLGGGKKLVRIVSQSGRIKYLVVPEDFDTASAPEFYQQLNRGELQLDDNVTTDRLKRIKLIMDLRCIGFSPRECAEYLNVPLHIVNGDLFKVRHGHISWTSDETVANTATAGLD